MKTITVNNKEQLFCQYDNQCKQGNRILMFNSDRATDILKSAKFFGMDGTFKKAPIIFYQIFRIIAIQKSDNFPCVFMLIEKYSFQTNLEAMV